MKRYAGYRVLSDIDGVLAHTAAVSLSRLNKECGTTHVLEDLTSIDIIIQLACSALGCDPTTAFAYLFGPDVLWHVQPDISAQAVFRFLANEGAEMAVVTSRPASDVEVTLAWLAQHFPMVSPQAVFIRSNEEQMGIASADWKLQHVQMVQPQAYFEDDPSTLQHILDAWAQSDEPFHLIDQPWNRSCPPTKSHPLDRYRATWQEQQERFLYGSLT